MPLTELLSTKQAAGALGVSAPRVRQLIATGQLPATRLGRDWFIAPTDLAALVRRPVGYPPGRPRK